MKRERKKEKERKITKTREAVFNTFATDTPSVQLKLHNIFDAPKISLYSPAQPG